jgi:hypothetical protein
MKTAETSVSGLAKTNRNTCHLKREVGGRARTEEMNATWNETRMWFAMTHPSWSAAGDAQGGVQPRRSHLCTTPALLPSVDSGSART